MAGLYYREDLDAEAFAAGATVEVTGDEAHHAVRVSRLRSGEETLVGNGRGAIGRGPVTEAGKDRFAVRLDEAWHVPAPEPRLVLAQALAKGDRDERAVEQATEYGVDAVVPWEAERSVSRWGAEKAERGAAKWRRVAREASKQSLRARVPEVAGPAGLGELCALAGREGSEVVVLHPRGSSALSDWARTLARAAAPAPREIALVVGPEGGLSGAELDAFERSGARILSLGAHVLRTSSAGPAALAVLNVALGRW